jgi:hypothetical protein
MTADPGIKRLLFGIELTLFAIVLGLTVGNAALMGLVALAGLVVALTAFGGSSAADPDALPDIPAA